MPVTSLNEIPPSNARDTSPRSTLPVIVFCTTCKGRTSHLERTLPRNMADNADYPNAKFVILDYYDHGDLATYLQLHHAADIVSGRLTVYLMSDPSPFRMAHAKNMAHRCGILEGADILVNMDADNYGAPGFATWIAEQFATAGIEKTFLWSNAKSVIGRARQGLAGRTAVSRNLFWKLGGYDEKYTDWAPEDEDFKCRAKRLLCSPGINIEDRFLHVIPHKDGLRFKEYPHAKPTLESEAAALKSIRESSDVIANFGQCGTGVVYRNFSPEPIHLHRIPTRIFGIGMHKTATTSLDAAFGILGIDSAHWKGPWWVKRIWEEMVCGATVYGSTARASIAHSPTIEESYAFSDLPFTLIYREIDKLFPGSKYILTIRNENIWIKSVRQHWIKNRARYEWDKDCFTHRIHTELYGTREFDAEVMLARYRRHNIEVLEYFRHRPHDLLVMDMDRGAGWSELCRFLRMPMPGVPYPVRFKADAIEDAADYQI